jgi:hypothetical protein
MEDLPGPMDGYTTPKVPTATNTFPSQPSGPGNWPTWNMWAINEASIGSMSVATAIITFSKYAMAKAKRFGWRQLACKKQQLNSSLGIIIRKSNSS